MSFDFLIDYYPLLIEGTVITVLLALLTVLFGTLIGVFVSLIKFYDHHIVGKVLNKVANGYVAFFRGTPLMIQLYLLYYGLPQLGVQYPSIPGISTAFLVGVLTLSINSGAYVSEIFRAGIQAVDAGQMEAGRSLGLNQYQTLKHIILPQAIKNILPALGNEFIVIIKESAIVSIIGLSDLMYMSDVIRMATFNPFGVLIVVAFIYFILTTGLAKLLKILEGRLNQHA
ncbi:MAG TPA: arginine ABC transporter permease [Firmicutes bacterium]|nr:arginine ABC transporter permease [Bacillota bacterium]